MVEKKDRNTAGKTTPHCPYCDEEMQQAKLPWCQACGIKLSLCPQCGQPISGELSSCPRCGKKISVK